ncbi:hypothetical protein ACH5RR_013193 [Cinchona calisaya]|uniref:Craniofacial development protein 2-like n=1 Tax=Cinchona calisaya TaxID=153742 RepID=A0ABD2ZZC6_9GENT
MQGFSHNRGRVMEKKNVMKNRIRITTWNIETLTGKSMEVIDIMIRRKNNILYLQEKMGRRYGELLDNFGFKLWYSRVNKTRNEIGIIVDGPMKDDIVQVTRKAYRIMTLKLILGRKTIKIFSIYAPQIGLDESIKAKFWEDLDKFISSVPQEEQIFIGGDLNGHVRRDN